MTGKILYHINRTFPFQSYFMDIFAFTLQARKNTCRVLYFRICFDTTNYRFYKETEIPINSFKGR